MDGTYLFLKQYDRVTKLNNNIDMFDKQSDDVKNKLKMLDMDPHTLLEKEVLELSKIYNVYEYGGIDKRIVRNKIGSNSIALYDHLPNAHNNIFETYYGGKKKKKLSIKQKRKSRKARSKRRTKKYKRRTKQNPIQI